MDPELSKAFIKAIEKYFKDDVFDRPKSMEKMKYNKKYFDDAEGKFFPSGKATIPSTGNKEEKAEKKVKKEIKDGI